MVERIDGPIEEFEAFVRRAYPGLVRFGGMLVGDVGRGEDLVQAGLMKVYAAWPRLNSSEAAGAYTRKVMVREAGRWRRRRWTGEHPTAAVPDAVSVAGADERVADQARLVVALRSLPLAQRAVLVLRYLEQCSETEVATILGISPGTVKSRTARAFESLRNCGLLNDDVPAGRD